MVLERHSVGGRTSLSVSRLSFVSKFSTSKSLLRVAVATPEEKREGGERLRRAGMNRVMFLSPRGGYATRRLW